MNRRVDCLIYVLIAGVTSYLTQVSHVPREQVATWSLHEWAGALLFVGLAVLNAWKAFRSDPNAKTGGTPAV